MHHRVRLDRNLLSWPFWQQPQQRRQMALLFGSPSSFFIGRRMRSSDSLLRSVPFPQKFACISRLQWAAAAAVAERREEKRKNRNGAALPLPSRKLRFFFARGSLRGREGERKREREGEIGREREREGAMAGITISPPPPPIENVHQFTTQSLETANKERARCDGQGED